MKIHKQVPCFSLEGQIRTLDDAIDIYSLSEKLPAMKSSLEDLRDEPLNIVLIKLIFTLSDYVNSADYLSGGATTGMCELTDVTDVEKYIKMEV